MATYGSRHAVEAALEIVARVDELNAAARIPPTRIGIGLHAGEAVTGNVGSAQRKEYTIIGDVVNLASRIEQLNKQFNSQLLVSEVVWQAINQDVKKEATPLGPVHVKGHEALVQVYQLA
jgi:adenylate cyclase